ncbi:MAG: ABC transporter substrate-binding protein [Proteobacteria bacterium]|nr:ABC transporter substrate-binding protein [Pseudomonadota bacterium]
MRSRRIMKRLAAALFAIGAVAAQAQQKVVFQTNWFAQAEHGGLYQALAEGTYRKHGLDVTLRMGGAQVNGLQLLAVGQVDMWMGFDIVNYKAWEQGVPAVSVATFFQKDPTVVIAHSDVKQFADLKTKTVLVSADGQTNWWPWAKAKYGLRDEQTRPYTFNVQPFVANRNVAQQGYLTSETLAVQKAGVKDATVFLLADLGYPPYTETVTVLRKTIEQRPAMIEAFLRATMEGWRSYLANPAPGNALIKKDNPAMSDELLAYGLQKIKQMGLVTGGDAAKQGIGIITEARMKQTWDMMVANKLIDPSKVKFHDAWDDRFVRDLKVMP